MFSRRSGWRCADLEKRRGLKVGLNFARHARYNGGSGGGAAAGTATGTDGGEGDDPEAAKLLNEIQKRLDARFAAQGKKMTDETREAAKLMIEETFKGIPIEELRSLVATGDSSLQATVKRMAAKIDNLARRGGQEITRVGLRETLQTRMQDVEAAFRQGSAPAVLNVRAAVPMDTTNTITYPEDIPNDLIESFSFAEYIPKRQGADWIWNLVDRQVVQEITQYKTWMEEGDIEGAFAVVAEGALKPLMSATLVRNIAETSKAAAKYVITEEFAKFRRVAYNRIAQMIRDEVARDYVDIITAGIIAASAGYIGTSLDGTFTNPNDYDAIGAVAAQIESLNFVPNMLAMHPQDKWRIRLLKDQQGQYLFPVTTENGVTRVFEFVVTTSTKLATGNFVLGESGLYKVEEEPLTVRIGYGITMNGATPEHDFDHNRLRIIIEVFFNHWLATNHEGSFVYASFAAVKADLQSV